MTDEEEVTREEIQEEWDFIDAILETKIMDIARDFLISKGNGGRGGGDFKHPL